MIELNDICKAYAGDGVAVRALKNVTLTISMGEFTAITGASGSGKSTLMHIMGFMDAWDSGGYRFMGEVICPQTSETRLARLRSEHIGFVFQQFNLLPRLTALENVLLPRQFSTDKRPARAKAKELLDMVGLSHKLLSKPTALSGGEKQRVAIARALINNPKIILADEPTGALDSENAGNILSLLKTLNAGGRTIVLVTHDQGIASACARQIRMKDGSAT